MNKTIVFIHGAWVTPLCWEKFSEYFEGKGYTCHAPAWPYKDRPIDDLRKNPDPRLGTLGISEIVDHYEKFIHELSESPILIGHSFGGLFTQMLLDRGVGTAGIVIDSAPPKGVFAFYPTVLKANFSILSTIGGWSKVLQPSFKDFQYAFVNTLPENEQRAAFDRYVVPESGRIFFQAAAAPLPGQNITKVDFGNNKRSPLLLIGGAEDHIIPAKMNEDNYRKYQASTARTDFKVFEKRTHWIISQPEWEEVAGYIEGWVKRTL